jgi:hypothetical protein
MMEVLALLATLAIVLLLGYALLMERRRQDREDLEWHEQWLESIKHPSTANRCRCGSRTLLPGVAHCLDGSALHGRDECRELEKDQD